MRSALLAILVLAPLAALAQTATPAPTAPAPNPHLAAAQRLYQKLDLDAAIAELQQAEQGSKDNEDETVQILIYRGLIYSDLGKTNEANDMFKRALAMRPWAEVPPETSPRLAKVFGDARKSLWGTAATIKPPVKKPSRSASSAPAPAPAAAPAPAPQAAPAPAPAPAPAAPAPEAPKQP
jgi:tetratricopeptide (TPR) repeat protein